ncbi:HAD family hydrolase [Pelagibacterium montanilacus]|uniref:HAD family hydrolase n=1 Tax=Pelagibacterium montanilacus TaxID=2185280 RepID=UPI000F8E2398|nr:HAD family hydrolase [Pelagibacterium montanilacus]
MARLTTIGFDADDTLWENEHFFRLTHAHFAELLADYAEPDVLSRTLLETEMRNLARYGFGIKGFTLSMIETAIEVTGGKVPGAVIGRIVNAGREMLAHPVDTLPNVHETLETMTRDHTLVLITKGDLFDQERKLAQSGLGEFFDAVEIVSDKTASTYRSAFARHGTGPEAAMMVGNSLRSDVIPAIEAGGWGTHVPHTLTWDYERAEPPVEAERFNAIGSLAQLPGLVETLKG